MSRWKYTVGERPHTVCVFERKGRKNLYIGTWDPELGTLRKRSLKHDDREKAKLQAAELHEKLLKGAEALGRAAITLAQLFALYEKYRTPQKGEREQKADARRIEMWTRYLGPEKDPHQISREEWERFVGQRSSAGIDPRARPREHTDYSSRGEVGPRTVERDLRFLLAVLNWGTDWHTGDGYLLEQNVCRGYPIPKERNPKRPVATDRRVEKIREKAPEVTMDVTWGEKRKAVTSHLDTLFELAVETGRRLSSILALRHSDLLLDRGPHGAIRWRAEADKGGRESTIPITPRARRAIKRQQARLRALSLPGIGDAPLFPSPKNPSEPTGRSPASRWLRKAERLAGLEPQEGSLWHAYRRYWATARKGMPAPDVAKAGGWAGPETLEHVYQAADEDTLYEVVTGGGEVHAVSE